MKLIATTVPCASVLCGPVTLLWQDLIIPLDLPGYNVFGFSSAMPVIGYRSNAIALKMCHILASRLVAMNSNPSY